MDNFNQSNVTQAVPRGQAQPTHVLHTQSFALAQAQSDISGPVGADTLNSIVLDGGAEGTNILGQGIPFAQLNWPVPRGPRSPDQMPVFGSPNLRIPPAVMPDSRGMRIDLQATTPAPRQPRHQAWMGMPLRPDPVAFGMAPVVPNGPRQPRQQAVMGCPANLTYMFYRVYGTLIH